MHPGGRTAIRKAPSSKPGAAPTQVKNASNAALVSSDRKARKTARKTADATVSVLPPSRDAAGLDCPVAAMFFCPVAAVSELFPSRTAINPDTPPSAPTMRGNSSNSGGPNTVMADSTIHPAMMMSIHAPKRAHHSRSSSSIHRNFDTAPMNSVMPARVAAMTVGTARMV